MLLNSTRITTTVAKLVVSDSTKMTALGSIVSRGSFVNSSTHARRTKSRCQGVPNICMFFSFESRGRKTYLPSLLLPSPHHSPPQPPPLHSLHPPPPPLQPYHSLLPGVPLHRTWHAKSGGFGSSCTRMTLSRARVVNSSSSSTRSSCRCCFSRKGNIWLNQTATSRNTRAKGVAGGGGEGGGLMLCMAVIV